MEPATVDNECDGNFKSKNNTVQGNAIKQTGPKLVRSPEQRKVLEIMTIVEEKLATIRDVYQSCSRYCVVCNTMDTLINFVDRLSDPAPTSIPIVGRFQCKLDEWSTKVDRSRARYGDQIMLTRNVNTQHGPSIIYLSRKLMDPTMVHEHVVC